MLRIEIEREADGRFIAEVPELPGAMVYEDSREAAVVKVEALAGRILADRVDGEIASGSYASAGEVVRDGLGLLRREKAAMTRRWRSCAERFASASKRRGRAVSQSDRLPTSVIRSMQKSGELSADRSGGE